MANNAAVTDSGIVGLSWSAPSSDGGSPVTNYQISSKVGAGGTYAVLNSVTSPTLSYTAGSLTAGSTYSFKVKALNLVGYGPESSEVNVIAAAKPSVPAAPSTVNQLPNVLITWVAPANGGSQITGYTVAICQSDGTTFTAVSFCNVP